MANKLAKRAGNEVTSSSHAEFISASSTQAVTPWKQQRQALKILNQVQNDGTYFNNNAAFTLIELLVVVLIIGILAGVALPQYNKAVKRSRVAEAVTVLNTLIPAVDEYVLENDGYEGIGELVGVTAGDHKANKLSIDIESVLDCTDNRCESKHYYYDVYCSTDRCNMTAFPKEGTNDLPGLWFVKRAEDGGAWQKGCQAILSGADGTTNKSICESFGLLLEIHS